MLFFQGNKRKTADKTEEVVKRKKPKGAFFITEDGDSEGSQSGEEVFRNLFETIIIYFNLL